MFIVQKKPFLKAVLFFVALSLCIAPFNSASAAGGGAKPAANGPIYVDFKSIVVPVIRKDGRTGVIALNVMAEASDQKAESDITKNMPRLRDAFIRTLYGNMENKRFVSENGKLNIDHIKEHLIKTAAYVMKDSKTNPVKDILFQNIAQPRF